ncbi:papain-like cysteine peptidase [Streptomyces sp. NBC_00872]|uniref:papain-like cysteine peptidase n=1 Tax=Streptomyces sp. NBC_00872 TaxID=2903686 RepID=UPI00386A3522|nr:papain-like cysteine peptidase [Streptomyces sp. NBC_00872]
MYDRLVGLGYHCESTYQIRRITGDDRAHFFDWLDLDFESVVETIATDFANVLRPGMVEPFSDGLCALDRGSDIRFFHDFHPASGTMLSGQDIHGQLGSVRAKFAALADRWRTLAGSPARVLYIHNDAFDELTAADLRRLRLIIATAHPGHRFDLLWLRRTPPPDADTLGPGIGWGTVAAAPGRWQGDDAQWDTALRGIRLAGGPRPAARHQLSTMTDRSTPV